MRVGCIGYATEQGVGHLAKSFYDASVITHPAIFLHDQRKNHLDWYPEGTPTFETVPFAGPKVDAYVRSVDVLMFFETPWDWSLLRYCKERGVKTVLVPMYEWFPRRPEYLPDKFICPSLLDYDYFRHHNAEFIPVPVDVSWQLRTKARRYLHNAGGIGFREHKGTRELLLAMKYVKSDLQLTVRSQDEEGLRKILLETNTITNGRIKVEFGNKQYKDLWQDYDVLVAPEKFNGLSLPLQEARAAGMLVMTTNRFPMNTWLPTDPLIPVSKQFRTRIADHLQEIDECVMEPQTIARIMDLWYDRDISDYSLGGREWATQNSWQALKPRWLEGLAI